MIRTDSTLVLALCNTQQRWHGLWMDGLSQGFVHFRHSLALAESLQIPILRYLYHLIRKALSTILHVLISSSYSNGIYLSTGPKLNKAQPMQIKRYEQVAMSMPQHQTPDPVPRGVKQEKIKQCYVLLAIYTCLASVSQPIKHASQCRLAQ